MAKGYYTAKQIVEESLLGIGDVEGKHWLDGVMYFMRGYRDFQLTTAYQEKEAWFPIDATVRTIKMNDDCIRVTTVGVNIHGEFCSFTKSDDMVSPSDDLDGELFTDRNETESINRSPSDGYNAVGVNVEYYYKPDYEKRRIILNRAAVNTTRFADRAEALVKYISNNVDNLETARVPMDAANMLISFVEWKLVASMPKKYDSRYRQEKQLEYERNETRYRLLMLPDIDELLDTIYETAGQGVRL